MQDDSTTRPDPIAVELDQRRRREWVFVAGLILAGIGVYGIIESVFDPYEYCNAFRCVKDYNAGAIAASVLVLAVGSWFMWVSRRRR